MRQGPGNAQTGRHRFYLEESRIDGERVLLTAAQTHQISQVLRLRPGDRIRVFTGEPCDLVVELTTVGRGRGEGRVVEWLPQPPEPPIPVTAYLSLLPRDRLEYALQKLVEVGAAAIAPVITARTLARRGPATAQLARWRSILREAAEQCGRGFLPALLPPQPLPAALTEAAGSGVVVIAWEGEREVRLSDLGGWLRGAARIGVFVGPEGGFTSEEVARARAAGARCTTLGPRILRAETAAVVLTALVLEHTEGTAEYPRSDGV